jgi:hypothetical protein
MNEGRILNPLTNLEETIRTHWLSYRPAMSAELEAAGTLDDSIRRAAANTKEAVQQLIDKGHALLEAWEGVREQWAILPAEEVEDDEDDDPAWRILWATDEDEDDDWWDEDDAEGEG